MHVSPALAEAGTYPFVHLDRAKREAAARGIELIDFGAGDPREPTDPVIRHALADAVRERMGYPLSVGLLELREAIAGWVRRRFRVELDSEAEIIPTLGSKEAIFSFAQIVTDSTSLKDTVAVPDPAYPVYARGALFAHARVLSIPLEAKSGFLPDLDALEPDDWSRIAIFWVNYPNNPTGAVAPLAFYERLAQLALEHDFLVASDEAYSELWFDEPPPSALQVSDRRNVVAFNTLSKRSSMTGYRSGFVAASSEVIASLRTFRPTAGTAPQEFVQRASVVAWNDEAHVERARDSYRRKRQIVRGVLKARGIRVAGSEASMYLWAEVPAGETSEGFASRLLDHGIVVAPGSYLGDAGEGYVRIALVPTEDECRRAAEILEAIL